MLHSKDDKKQDFPSLLGLYFTLQLVVINISPSQSWRSAPHGAECWSRVGWVHCATNHVTTNVSPDPPTQGLAVKEHDDRSALEGSDRS